MIVLLLQLWVSIVCCVCTDLLFLCRAFLPLTPRSHDSHTPQFSGGWLKQFPNWLCQFLVSSRPNNHYQHFHTVLWWAPCPNKVQIPSCSREASRPSLHVRSFCQSSPAQRIPALRTACSSRCALLATPLHGVPSLLPLQVTSSEFFSQPLTCLAWLPWYLLFSFLLSHLTSVRPFIAIPSIQQSARLLINSQ